MNPLFILIIKITFKYCRKYIGKNKKVNILKQQLNINNVYIFLKISVID